MKNKQNNTLVPQKKCLMCCVRAYCSLYILRAAEVVQNVVDIQITLPLNEPYCSSHFNVPKHICSNDVRLFLITGLSVILKSFSGVRKTLIECVRCFVFSFTGFDQEKTLVLQCCMASKSILMAWIFNSRESDIQKLVSQILRQYVTCSVNIHIYIYFLSVSL